MLNLTVIVQNCTKPCYELGRHWNCLLPLSSLLVAPGLRCISLGQLMSVATDRGCLWDQANEGVPHQKPLLLTLQCIFHRCKDCFYFFCLLPIWSKKITCIQQQTLRCFSNPGVEKVLHFKSLGNWPWRMGQEGTMGFALGQPQNLFLVIQVKSLLLIVKNFCTVASVMTI